MNKESEIISDNCTDPTPQSSKQDNELDKFPNDEGGNKGGQAIKTHH